MPESNESKAVIARRKQAESAKTATLDKLLNKRRATSEFKIHLDGEELTIKFQALGSQAYDKLVAKHPPTTAQRAEGSTFNMDTFAPALVAACSLEPEMSEEETKAIWASDDWSRGDLMVFFRNAVELNNRGLDIPFNETD